MEATAEVVAAAIAEHGPFDAVFASGQSDLEGAALCKANGVIPPECSVYGYDLNAHILGWVADGTIAGTVDQQPYLQGYIPVIQLALYCRFSRYGIEPCDMDARANLVTKQNVEAVVARVAGPQ
jgi:simple sugar transport system substrate-binding protein